MCFRVSQGRLRADQPGPRSVQQRVRGPAPGRVHMPASPRTTQLHSRGSLRGKQALRFEFALAVDLACIMK